MTATQTQAQLRNNPYKVAIASMVGTAIEFYDYYIYAAAAVLVFNTQFFDKSDHNVAILLSLSTLALAFFARPIGSALFGHFGDKIGRKKTLVASLLTMGLSTVCIGLLPTYDQIGFYCVFAASGKVWAWAANGAARLWLPPKTRPKANAHGSARSRSWARRLACLWQTARSSPSARWWGMTNWCNGAGAFRSCCRLCW